MARLIPAFALLIHLADSINPPTKFSYEEPYSPYPQFPQLPGWDYNYWRAPVLDLEEVATEITAFPQIRQSLPPAKYSLRFTFDSAGYAQWCRDYPVFCHDPRFERPTATLPDCPLTQGQRESLFKIEAAALAEWNSLFSPQPCDQPEATKFSAETQFPSLDWLPYPSASLAGPKGVTSAMSFGIGMDPNLKAYASAPALDLDLGDLGGYKRSLASLYAQSYPQPQEPFTQAFPPAPYPQSAYPRSPYPQSPYPQASYPLAPNAYPQANDYPSYPGYPQTSWSQRSIPRSTYGWNNGQGGPNYWSRFFGQDWWRK